MIDLRPVLQRLEMLGVLFLTPYCVDGARFYNKAAGGSLGELADC